MAVRVWSTIVLAGCSLKVGVDARAGPATTSVLKAMAETARGS
jgi:hypothetical protein